MIDAGLYALLGTNAALTAQLPNGAGSIFAVEGPDDASQMPYVTYSYVGGASDPTLSTSGVIRQRIELNAYAIAADSSDNSPGTVAANIRAAVIKAVNGWQQTLGDGTSVLNAVLANPGTDFCTEQRIFRCMCEFYVLYTLPS